MPDTLEKSNTFLKLSAVVVVVAVPVALTVLFLSVMLCSLPVSVTPFPLLYKLALLLTITFSIVPVQGATKLSRLPVILVPSVSPSDKGTYCWVFILPLKFATIKWYEYLPSRLAVFAVIALAWPLVIPVLAVFAVIAFVCDVDIVVVSPLNAVELLVPNPGNDVMDFILVSKELDATVCTLVSSIISSIFSLRNWIAASLGELEAEHFQWLLLSGYFYNGHI